MKNSEPLFDKVIAFTDIHFGMKNNAKTHNLDCLKFIDWMIEKAKDQNIKTCIFGGDWHHQRASVNVSTLNYTLKGLQKLNDNFDNVYMIPGNHDEYYKDTREMNSIQFAELYPNIQILNEPIVKGDVGFIPWLVGDEWKQVPKIKCKYMFGHFELPHFYMNAMVQMPDHGQISESHFKHPELVFSGHFHKRQAKGKIVYMGNPFPHNYADAWDDDRGCMTLTWGEEPEFHNWEEAPKYRTISLAKLMRDPDRVLSPNVHARVTIDKEISYEEANFIKDTFMHHYKLRELTLIPEKNTEHEEMEGADIEFQSVDQIVIQQLQAVESETFDNNVLIAIYNSL